MNKEQQVHDNASETMINWLKQYFTNVEQNIL